MKQTTPTTTNDNDSQNSSANGARDDHSGVTKRSMNKQDFFEMDPSIRSEVEILEPYYVDSSSGERVYVDFFENLPPTAK